LHGVCVLFVLSASRVLGLLILALAMFGLVHKSVRSGVTRLKNGVQSYLHGLSVLFAPAPLMFWPYTY